MFAAKDTLLTRPSGGYVIPRSLRFRASATAYLNRTFGTPTSNSVWTLSLWMKRGALSADMMLFGASTDSNNYAIFYFATSTDTLRYIARSGGADVGTLTSARVFRDPSAFMHVVITRSSATTCREDW